MKISIALCTFNGEKFLQEQLDSFLEQTRLPDELVVCDDQSTDNTQFILNSFALLAPFPVKIYINTANLGSTKNFEKAISLCKGDIIFLSDQDDIWHKNKIEVFVNSFSNEQIGMVFSDLEIVDENLNLLGYSNWESLKFNVNDQNSFTKGEGMKILLNRNVVTGCALAFRKNYLNIILPIPDDIPLVIHDYWISLILLGLTEAKLVCSKTVKYRQHSSQQVGSKLFEVKKSSGSLQEKLKTTASFESQLYFYNLVKDRLGTKTPKKFSLLELNRRISHLTLRQSLQEGCKKNVTFIFRDLINGSYFSYSNGWKSAIKDIFNYLFK